MPKLARLSLTEPKDIVVLGFHQLEKELGAISYEENDETWYDTYRIADPEVMDVLRDHRFTADRARVTIAPGKPDDFPVVTQTW